MTIGKPRISTNVFLDRDRDSGLCTLPRRNAFEGWRAALRSHWRGMNAGTRNRELAIISAIVLLAIAIRLPALIGDGLWRDEANVYVGVAAPSFGEFFSRVMAIEWHPPLYFLMMYCWVKVVGTSEFALKIVPFIFSIATVAVVYRVGRAVASFASGAIGAGLYAVAPFAVEYSSDYLYPVAACLCTLLAWLVLDARERPLGAGRFARLALVSLLVVFTHYTGLFYIPLVVIWELVNEGSLRDRITVAAALIAGAAPFILWVPVLIRQWQIGVPYATAATVIDKLYFFLGMLVQFIPLRPDRLAAVFAALILIAIVALVRARAIERDAAALAAIVLAMLAIISVANLRASRYAFPFYGVACAVAGCVLARFGSRAAAADTVAWRRWGMLTTIVLGFACVADDAMSAIATSRIPKSGIRTIVHRPQVDALTLYLIAPDYLASTFAYYARDTHARFTGFVRRSKPEVFRLANYAADWNRADAVDRALWSVLSAPRSDTVLDVVVDDGAHDEGDVPYGKVQVLLHALGTRYRLLGGVKHPGRYESVTEYRYQRERL